MSKRLALTSRYCLETVTPTSGDAPGNPLFNNGLQIPGPKAKVTIREPDSNEEKLRPQVA